MKILTRALALSLLVIVISMLFASCGFIKDAINNAINHEEEEDVISIEDAKAKFDAEGYDTYVFENDNYTVLQAGCRNTGADSYMIPYYHVMLAMYFDNTKAATEYYEKLMEKETNLPAYTGYNESEMIFGQKGRIVYYAHPFAVDIMFGE